MAPKGNVQITYQNPGTAPPMFVAGSLTEPAWQPVELDAEEINGEYIFTKTFELTPGSYSTNSELDRETGGLRTVQNPLVSIVRTRTGNLADTLLESDGTGNYNNLLEVKGKPVETPNHTRCSSSPNFNINTISPRN